MHTQTSFAYPFPVTPLAAVPASREVGLPAREAFHRLSPGSTFFASDCGLHVGIENIMITLDYRDFYTCLAVYCDGDGDVHRISLRCKLAARPFAMTPAMVLGETTVELIALLPQGISRDLMAVLPLARQLLQRRAAEGWDWPEQPLPPSPFPGAPSAFPAHVTSHGAVADAIYPFTTAHSPRPQTRYVLHA